ncbi:hypothetical protein CAPTEDRAFT_221571 [Capitella teleta]|uniref:Uncharacterized protein n=1 Tax=Capitella teleta TaxID=283909 RepID=R7V8X7_CAPTE|nr:hypothetical protein CAPTEDRAFT_221571 [Capitella teleta]|eukprot:ELU15298.1 hypothetical protein CAPTEDRAFT_221571 [Capitella teleta]
MTPAPSEASFHLVGAALQLLACLATSVTFLRISNEVHIPLVFMALPGMLFVLLAYRILFKQTDKSNLGMFTGASTGFICGFLSSIINHDNEIPTGDHRASHLVKLLYSMEVLHIPVLIGSLVYTLCLVMERFPLINSLFLAIATSTCVAMTATVGTVIYDGEETARTTLSYANIFVITLVESFLIILLPVIRQSQRPWVWATTAFLPCLIWQGNFFDCLVWDASAPRFPLPGCLTGLIISAHADLLTLKSKHQKYTHEDPMENLLNGFTWHVVTFVVQRLSLAVILLGNSAPSAVEAGNDVWLCCLMMIAFLALVAPGNRIQPSTKVVIVLAGLVFYLSVTITNEILTNGYFIDSALGLTILYAVQHHHSVNHRRSVLSY